MVNSLFQTVNKSFAPCFHTVLFESAVCCYSITCFATFIKSDLSKEFSSYLRADNIRPHRFVQKEKTAQFLYCLSWSGWRGSNPLPPPWQGGALPDELHPHFIGASGRNRTTDTGIFSPLLYRLSYRGKNWRPGTGSNRRPLAWQASVLTNWTTGPNVVGTTGLEPVTLCL